MADPATMMLVGAGLGAASNRDDPMKGAMMGAALGGLGGAGYGAFTGGAAGAAGATGAAEAAGVFPATMAEFMPTGPEIMGAEGLAVPQFMPGATAFPVPSEVGMRAGFAYPDVDAIARASLGSDLPGASAVGGASPYSGMAMNPMAAMAAQSLLRPPEQPQMGGGGVRRGDPRALNDAVISLLAPKQISKRKISLL